jgi:DNA-binding HxlR family transcriptional regulator
MKKVKSRSKCPISCLLDIIGDKWSLLIIRDIMFKNINTYGSFLTSDEKISTNILADRLALLKTKGFIKAHSHPDNRLKIVYTLTQKGLDLMPILMEIALWSDKYLEISDRGKELAKTVRADREAFIKKITDKHTVRNRKIPATDSRK